MLSFAKPALSDIQAIRPYFYLSASNICDNTVGGTYIWRDFLMLEYAIYNDTLVFKVNMRDDDDTAAFTFPIGRDIQGCIRGIESFCKHNGIPMTFCLVTEKDLGRIKELYENTVAVFNPDWSDYLYRKDDLVLLPGRKYSGQRNHINYFKRTYADYRFAQIDAGNVPAVKDFYINAVSAVNNNSGVFLEEKAKTAELLDNYEIYGLPGGVLYAGNDIVAFSIGEIVNDTLFVHVERADYSYRGAYQMIMNLFAAHYAGPEVKYINREEDVGDEGLRSAKMALHPVDILKKYTVYIVG